MKRRYCCGRKPLIFQIYQYTIIILAGILILSFLYHKSSLYYRKTITMPFSLHLNKQDIYMIKGEETHLSVFGINKRVSFHSTNFRVAGVNFNGRIFAYRTGEAFIIARVDRKELKCRVHVIDINRKSIELKTGSSYRLKIAGTGAYKRWKSSNSSVASVSMFGRVKAISRGNAVITARVKGRTLKCTVYVR